MHTATQLLAQDHWHGPGPWVLLFPLVWAAVIAGAVTLLRRAGLGRGRGPWQRGGPWRGVGESPVDVLSRRFAEGQIDENEYWMRLSVLNEARGGQSRKGEK